MVLAGAAGAGVRVWQLAGRDPLIWTDTADFHASSAAPWTSLELWAGARAAGAPALLKLVGGDDGGYVLWQAVVAVVCWAVLATSVFTVTGRRLRWPAALAVLAFSVTAPVTMWERSVLSESLALSLLALVVAASLQLACRPSWPRAVGLLGALALWSITRDSNAVVAAAGGTAVVLYVAVSWVRARHGSGAGAPRRRDPLVALGVGSLVLAAAVGWAASHGDRHAFPMRNVYEVRVLPYPDRVQWFADHGMPQADQFTGPGARAPYREEGLPPVVYVADDDATLGEWLDWVESDGRAAFARYVATHPTYLVTEPLRSPERVFNNARGDRGFYAPLDQREVPLVDDVLALPTSVALVAAFVAGGWALGRRRWSPALAVGAVTVALAVPHGVVAWHSDGMETARHLVVPALQLHLGALLMVLGLGSPRTTQVGDDGVGPATPVDVYDAPARVPSSPWPTTPR